MITVLKALRSSPFAEFNIAYYDPQKTSPSTLLSLVRKGGCPNASQVAPRSDAASKVSAKLRSPVVVAGDWAWLTITLPVGEQGRLRIEAPAGWKLLGEAAVEVALEGGTNTVPVAVPTNATQGERDLEVVVSRTSSQTATLSVPVEVVRWVP